jgi:hypothetical protein
VNGAGIEIDVAPREPGRLARAEPEVQHHHPHRFELRSAAAAKSSFASATVSDFPDLGFAAVAGISTMDATFRAIRLRR